MCRIEFCLTKFSAKNCLRRSFEMGPQDVVKFCSECVLSDGDEPCDIPDGFYNHALGQLHP